MGRSVKNENQKRDDAGVEAIFRRGHRGSALAERFVRGRERNFHESSE